MKFEAAEKRLYKGIWICQRCNARHRAGLGKRPDKCRKCGSKRLRLKKKRAKK